MADEFQRALRMMRSRDGATAEDGFALLEAWASGGAPAGTVLAGVLCGAVFLLLHLAGGMGLGDVKLAGVLGLYLGFYGWAPVVVGAFLGFVVGGLVGLALIAVGRAGRKSAVPYGPSMLVGAWLGPAWGAASQGPMIAANPST